MRIATSTRSVHLVDLGIDPDFQSTIEVPAGICRLTIRGDGPIELSPLDGPNAEPNSASGGEVLVEPVPRGRELRLLVAAAPGTVVRVNGELDLGLASLEPGDVMQVADRVVHLAEHVHCVIGTAPAELAERLCPVCQKPARTDPVYLCPACGAPVHCRPDDGTGEVEGRQCLLGRECPCCRSAVMTDGYRQLPEL